MDENIEKKDEVKSQSENSEVKPYFFTLELDRPREIRYSWKAIKRLEQHFKLPVIKLLEYLQEKLSSGTISTDDMLEFLWHGLLKDDSELTKDKLEDLLDDSIGGFIELIKLCEKIFEGLAGAMPEAVKSLKKRVEEGAQEVDLRLPGRKSRKTGTGKKSSKRR